MSFEGIKTNWSLLSAADLRTKQYYAVDVDTSGEAALAGAGEQVFGSLQNKPNTGETADVQVGGIAKFVAGAATTLGGNLASDANGKLIDATTGDAIVGICLEAAAADLDIIAVFITNAGESA